MHYAYAPFPTYEWHRSEHVNAQKQYLRDPYTQKNLLFSPSLWKNSSCICQFLDTTAEPFPFVKYEYIPENKRD